ncbi:M48 family peptidase [Streptacidiphilus pinicola]|uniref:M48 family peptidase n=1 Tax=Streptacidiphilus pinicola TaxID=2219663 RepID=A0A2X0J1G5_9ACTN|nr:M48 family metallopeptidase [Streptacidiphilus pinicola]RAG81188.1 M48 family peptidase [Streptacidiphilus pinicola]
MSALEDDFTPAEIARSRARKREVAPLRYGSMVIGLVVPLVLGFTPVGAGLVRQAGRVGGGGWVATAALGAVALQLVLLVLGLPLSLRAEVVNRRWGLSRRSWRLFAADAAKGFGIGAVLFAGVAVVLYALMRWLPDTWWVLAAIGAAALVVAMSFLLPVVVEPLFNRFTPLPEGELRAALTAMVGASGVRVRDILVSDASRRTSAVNAYVSGIGRTRRVVVWDTTVEQAAPPEVAAVAAHELGHAARRDVLHGTLVGALGAAASVCVLAAALHWSPLLAAAGVAHASDPRSLALVMALGTVGGAVAGPVYNARSRQVEARADAYALDLTRAPETVVAMQRRLAVVNIADLAPHPLAVTLFASHPPTTSRIAQARAWARNHGLPDPPRLGVH